MRHIPIFTFINKMDREANDPFELLDEIESVLGIATCPINWPIGCGKEFKGVYDRKEKNVSLFKAAMNGQKEVDTEMVDASDEAVLKDRIGDAFYDKLQEDIELLDGASAEFDQEMVSAGDLTPVFFGSALTNFGVQTFLEHFLSMTTSPLPRKSDQGVIDPFTEDFSAFVFKIQANMNKAHRDRIAFMRICSGKFEAGMEANHVQGGKKIRLSQPQQMMASEREVISEAYAGDIIGVFDPGVFSIGDTLCSPKKKVKFEGIPTFAPEHFARIRQKDTLKRKQFIKGTTQIAQEGAIQIFSEPQSGFEEVIVGVVGVLQFEVLEYRLKNEYNVDIIREGLPYEHIRWITSQKHLEGGLDELQKLVLTSDTKLIQDVKGNYLLIFTSEWNIKWALDKNPGLELAEFNRD